jgi:hypothetical protein
VLGITVPVMVTDSPATRPREGDTLTDELDLLEGPDATVGEVTASRAMQLRAAAAPAAAHRCMLESSVSSLLFGAGNSDFRIIPSGMGRFNAPDPGH